MVVTVTEGVVDVERSGDPGRVRVAAGKQLAVTPERQTTAVKSVDPAAVLAWRKGRLEYEGEPLEAVIAEWLDVMQSVK